MSKEMSLYNEYRRLWSDLPKNNEVSDFPLHLDIEITSACNLKCDMCPYHGKDATFRRPPRHMDFGLYKKIISEGIQKGLMAVKLNFGGEPLLYPRIIEAIKYAKYVGILDVHVNTNGLLLTPDMIKSLLSSGLDMLILSDYGMAEQYERAVILQSLKQLRGYPKPILRVKTERPELWDNVADEIFLHKYYNYCHLKTNFEKSDFKCEQPWQRLLVLVDGTICKCSCGLIVREKMTTNAKRTTIESVWKSGEMEFIRKCHRKGKSHLIPMCTVCPSRGEYIDKRFIIGK